MSSAAYPSALTASLLAMPNDGHVRKNVATIRDAISAAAAAGARLLLTPECALTGYPGFGRTDLEQLDWTAIASLEDELAEMALEAGIVLVLGTASPIRSGIANDALICGAVEREIRYRKRCLTGHDRDHFVPGYEPIVVPVAGWMVGIAICYDVRFPDVWADLALMGADCFACIAHLAGDEPDEGTKASVLPAHCASRAAELATPLLLCNTADDNRWVDSGSWDARGVAGPTIGEGFTTVGLVHRLQFDPWYAGIREQSLSRWRQRLRGAESIGPNW